MPQQSGFAYPLVAPYRGSGHPDDIVWFEPVPGRITTWRIDDEAFELAAPPSRTAQGELGLVPGENIPTIGDFDGDGRADYDLPPGETCGWFDGPDARVHLEGFAYSPFTCSWLCCRDELSWIAGLYFLASNELSEDPIEIHGQEFPVVDLDQPCD